MAHNHQEKNARHLEKNGAAKVVLENEVCGERIAEEILSVLSDKSNLQKMKEASAKIGITDACETIYNCIKELTKTK